MSNLKSNMSKPITYLLLWVLSHGLIGKAFLTKSRASSGLWLYEPAGEPEQYYQSYGRTTDRIRKTWFSKSFCVFTQSFGSPQLNVQDAPSIRAGRSCCCHCYCLSDTALMGRGVTKFMRSQCSVCEHLLCLAAQHSFLLVLHLCFSLSFLFYFIIYLDTHDCI